MSEPPNTDPTLLAAQVALLKSQVSAKELLIRLQQDVIQQLADLVKVGSSIDLQGDAIGRMSLLLGMILGFLDKHSYLEDSEDLKIWIELIESVYKDLKLSSPLGAAAIASLRKAADSDK